MATYTNPRDGLRRDPGGTGQAGWAGRGPGRRPVQIDDGRPVPDAFPDRYFEMGIAEANMMSTAAGLAVSGKIAFASSFRGLCDGSGLRPGFRQTISIGRLNVKICGSSCGLSIMEMARRIRRSKMWRSCALYRT